MAATTATASPTYRTLSTETGLCSGAFVSSVGSHAHGSEPSHSSAMSEPDHAPITSACASAGCTFTLLIRAWAYGLRTMPRNTVPG